MKSHDTNAWNEPGPRIDPEHELRPEPPPGTPLGNLDEELRRALEERDHLQERLLRSLAESDHARKRFAKDLHDALGRATADAVRPFLAVIDSFDLAARHRQDKEFEVLHRQLLEAVRKSGLEAIEAADRPFDPHLHQALDTVESDTVAEGTVVEELQRGYRLKDRLIRPAMVRVARPKAS